MAIIQDTTTTETLVSDDHKALAGFLLVVGIATLFWFCIIMGLSLLLTAPTPR